MKIPNQFRSYRIYSGVALLSLLAVQIITGILLSLYHMPSAKTAFQSLFFLRTEVFMGDTLHGIHHWGAVLLIFFSFIHGIQIMLERGYERKTTQWVVGAFLLFLLLNQDLSGRLLPFSQKAYWETTRSLEALQRIPLWGKVIFYATNAFNGISDLTYIRFYAFHISIVPGLILMILAYHLWTTVKLGSRTGFNVQLKKRPTLRVSFEIFLVTLGALATLSVLFSPKHGIPADTFKPYPGAEAVWYLRPFLHFANIIPPPISSTILALLLLSLFFIPWVEKRIKPPLPTIWGLLVTILYFALALGGRG